MINPIVYLLSTLISLYSYVLLAAIILSWLISFNVVNRSQPFVYKTNDVLNRLTEPALRPIRQRMPDLGGVDISPIILFILLRFVQYCLIYYFG